MTVKIYSPEDVKKILELHRKWFNGEDGGEQADLRSANLYGANLYGADLYGADLRSANLYGADLRSADLRSANLYGADLRSANLYGADLRSANLYGANLYGADLRSANLRSADLRSANLRSADLATANLLGRSVCPPKGAFTAYKAVSGGAILELLIPADAERVSTLIGRKCRTSRAKVVAVVKGEGTEFPSLHDSSFVYKVGKYVKTELDTDQTVECTKGIHFFMELAEAEEYLK